MTTPRHETPSPKVAPRTLKSDAPKNREEEIDRQVEDTFPASDPPSYSGGRHAIGAPENRESESPSPDSPAVKDAEKQVKDGKVSPDKY